MQKKLIVKVFALVLLFTSCLTGSSAKDNQSNKLDSLKLEKALPIRLLTPSCDEIQQLIRRVVKWSDSEYAIDLLPCISDENDSIYIGFDLDQLQQNLQLLKNTKLFSDHFIENYKQIILALDKKLKGNEFEYGAWYVGELAPFNFASGISPWCNCQDKMNWDLIEVVAISDLEYYWKWGGLTDEMHQSWKDFQYRFKVVHEEGNWKVDYLEGFELH